MVTLSEINPNNTAAETETWLTSLCLSEPFEHLKLLKNKPYGFLHLSSRENACRFFKKYDNSKIDESRNARVLGSIDWNRQPISYDIPFHRQAPNTLTSNPQAISNRAKIILLEVDIDDLQSKIHEHEAAIHRLRAEICLKEGQIKQRKVHF